MENFREHIDISLPLDSGTPIYPNNPPLRITAHKGATTVHSEVCLGSHTGTHVDTPLHVFPDRGGLEEFELDQLIGKALVVDVTSAKDKITTGDISQITLVQGMRILFKTSNSARGFREFYPNYVYLDGDCAEYLAQKRVSLVGIDAPSVKQRGGADNRPHTTLLENRIAILEGIDLSGVEAGEYTLLCLPLKFSNIDGASARAVLVR